MLLLDAGPAELVLGLPEEYLASDKAESKSVFRLAMKDIVPSAILGRKDKIGFAIPNSWLLEPGT